MRISDQGTGNYDFSFTNNMNNDDVLDNMLVMAEHTRHRDSRTTSQYTIRIFSEGKTASTTRISITPLKSEGILIDRLRRNSLPAWWAKEHVLSRISLIIVVHEDSIDECANFTGSDTNGLIACTAASSRRSGYIGSWRRTRRNAIKRHNRGNPSMRLSLTGALQEEDQSNTLEIQKDVPQGVAWQDWDKGNRAINTEYAGSNYRRRESGANAWRLAA